MWIFYSSNFHFQLFSVLGSSCFFSNRLFTLQWVRSSVAKTFLKTEEKKRKIVERQWFWASFFFQIKINEKFQTFQDSYVKLFSFRILFFRLRFAWCVTIGIRMHRVWKIEFELIEKEMLNWRQIRLKVKYFRL